MRKAAVFVDAQQGFEYGWLFRMADVMAAFHADSFRQTNDHATGAEGVGTDRDIFAAMAALESWGVQPASGGELR
jgi:hypothetical protein